MWADWQSYLKGSIGNTAGAQNMSEFQEDPIAAFRVIGNRDSVAQNLTVRYALHRRGGMCAQTSRVVCRRLCPWLRVAAWWVACRRRALVGAGRCGVRTCVRIATRRGTMEDYDPRGGVVPARQLRLGGTSTSRRGCDLF